MQHKSIPKPHREAHRGLSPHPIGLAAHSRPPRQSPPAQAPPPLLAAQCPPLQQKSAALQAAPASSRGGPGPDLSLGSDLFSTSHSTIRDLILPCPSSYIIRRESAGTDVVPVVAAWISLAQVALTVNDGRGLAVCHCLLTTATHGIVERQGGADLYRARSSSCHGARRSSAGWS